LGSSCFLSWNRLTEGHVWDGDFAEYVMQGESVWQGEISAFLQRNRFAMEESTYQVGPVAYPWGFPEVLVGHPTQGLKNTVATRWTDPETIVSQRPTDLAMGQLRVGFLLIDDRLFFVNRKRQGRRFFLGNPTLSRPFVVGRSADPQSFQGL
jgi:hypothetical protein